MNITLSGYEAIAFLIGITAVGSFVGCWVFVKVFEWNKLTINCKSKISRDEMLAAVNRIAIKEKISNR